MNKTQEIEGNDCLIAKLLIQSENIKKVISANNGRQIYIDDCYNATNFFSEWEIKSMMPSKPSTYLI